MTRTSVINTIDQAREPASHLKLAELRKLKYSQLRSVKRELSSKEKAAAEALQARIHLLELDEEYDVFGSEELPWENFQEAKGLRAVREDLSKVNAELSRRSVEREDFNHLVEDQTWSFVHGEIEEAA